MEFDELAEQMTQALVKQLAVVDQRQAEQRERWFEVVDDIKVERREKYNIAGHVVELPVIGMECPSRMDLDKIYLKTKNDLTQEKKSGAFRLLVNFFSGKTDETSPVTFGFTLKKTIPSKGILALYNRAGDEIIQVAKRISPEAAADIDRIRAEHVTSEEGEENHE